MYSTPVLALLPLLLLTLLCCRAPGSEASTAPSSGPGGNKLRASPNDVHRLVIDETPAVFALGSTDGKMHTSRVIEAEFPFNELVPSYNVDVPEGAGFVVELRFGRREGNYWTPFYYLGSWGTAPEPPAKLVRDDDGVVEIDYFASRRVFDHIQYRLRLAGRDTSRLPRLRRFALAYSNTLDNAELARRYRRPIDPGPADEWARRLAVPFRPQRAEDPRIAGSICSPTSVAMVLAYYGIDLPTIRVCETVWDAEHRIYGNWARAVQAAFVLGVPGYIERFGDFEAVKRHITCGRPVIASIRAAPGQLRGAPFHESEGHLLVITGFDHDGNVHVNDPAAMSAGEGITTYARQDMQVVWLANGGVGYVLTKPQDKER